METQHRVIPGLSQETFQIVGMTCAACVDRIERALTRIPAVQAVAVNLTTERVRIWYRAGAVSTKELIQVIEVLILVHSLARCISSFIWACLQRCLDLFEDAWMLTQPAIEVFDDFGMSNTGKTVIKLL